jgi:hypothetical protein
MAVKFIADWLLVVPVRFALTFAPPAQVADTVPATEVADCSEITHFKSAQLPIGRPAIDEEPHAPVKADAGLPVELVLPDEVEDPVGVVLPAATALPGAVGVRSVELFSNAQPVTSVEARKSANVKAVFMVLPWGFISAHTEPLCVSDRVTVEILKGRGGAESIAEKGRPRPG